MANPFSYGSPVDEGSRTFWVRGADAPLTLVEADGISLSAPRRDRLRDLLADHERGRVSATRPPGDPAFTETLLVELMRTGQFARAFDLVAPECQRRWGGPGRFAEAHGGPGLSLLRGASVLSVRLMDQWADPDHGTRHREVAELEVEYRFGAGERELALRRTVHLVVVEGRWRSICYPADASAAAQPSPGSQAGEAA